MSDPKILVTGGEGAFAQALAAEFPDATYVGRKRLDVRSWSSVDGKIASVAPDVVVHAAAITDHQCDDAAALIQTNVVGTTHAALAAQRAGAQLVYLSTHYVYPGARGDYVEEDDLNPIGAYAWSKYAGELATAVSKRCLVVRGSWYTPEKLAKWVKGAADDAFSSRVHVEDAARMVANLIRAGATGTVNIGGPRRSFAQICRAEGFTPLVVSRKKIKAPYPFPEDSSVDTSRYRAIVGG